MSEHVLVAGGAGFLGSHLCEQLLARGDRVTCVDNLSTGFLQNTSTFSEHPNYSFFQHDITETLSDCAELQAILRRHPLTRICNLASPASPPTYERLAIETLRVGSVGVQNLLDVAVESGSRFLQASTSEVYGDPDVHPQPETYWGNVNPIGPRSMYDESKRFAEAMCATYERVKCADVRIVRIFNTYGPRLSPGDGRVVTNFIGQALKNEPITIFGSGEQTRSFCFVDDEIQGLISLLDSDVRGPVNIGNPNEFTMHELADLVLELTGSTSSLTVRDLPGDDPKRRQPDITRARSLLGWEPKVQLREGLERTISWFRTLPEFVELADCNRSTR